MAQVGANPEGMVPGDPERVSGDRQFKSGIYNLIIRKLPI